MLLTPKERLRLAKCIDEDKCPVGRADERSQVSVTAAGPCAARGLMVRLGLRSLALDGGVPLRSVSPIPYDKSACCCFDNVTGDGFELVDFADASDPRE